MERSESVGTHAAVATRVLVLGGAGFVGRHAVAALLAAGATVIIGSRHPDRLDGRLPEGARACRRRSVRFESMTTADDWRLAIADCDVVLNCVGILRQRGRETYARVHHLAPAALARCCGEARKRLVHVSALGLDDRARSRFLSSKLAGERALRASGAEVCIVRPSLLDGEGGFGAHWLRMLARLPIHAFPVAASGRIAALDVGDLGEALAALVLAPPAPKDQGLTEYELGGGELRSLPEYVTALRRAHTSRGVVSIRVPAWLARAASHACDLLHVTPFSFGHWELLQRDNRPQPNRLAELLGREPRVVGVRVAASIGARAATQPG